LNYICGKSLQRYVRKEGGAKEINNGNAKKSISEILNVINSEKKIAVWKVNLRNRGMKF
jgi:hypothetical protein